MMKGLFKDYSGWMQLLVLLGAVLVGTIFFSLLGTVVAFVHLIITTGIDGSFTTALYGGMLMSDPTYMRLLQFFSACGTFVFPAFACAYLFSDNYKQYLSMDTRSDWKVYALTILGVITIIPFINFTTMLNMQMELPEWLSGVEEWMKKTEEAANQALEAMMKGKSVWTLLANLLVIAVMAGLGEEMFFRGVGQNIAAKIVKNPHAVIWIVAIIFSAIHFQFYGFLPRVLLGAYFGYLLYFTKNIWIPVLAHFAHNAISVLMYYFYQDSIKEMENIDALGWGDTWWVAVASLAIFVFIMSKIKAYSPNIRTKQAD